MNNVNAGSTCFHCGVELTHHDYYGRICQHQDGKVIGQIYKCLNEEADCFGTCYYDRSGVGDDELIEGYPC